MSKTFDVKHLAALTNLVVSDAEVESFSSQFEATLDTIKTLEELDTTNIAITPQVTNLENIYREDKVDETRMFSQSQALLNAHKTHHGYFVVPAVLE